METTRLKLVPESEHARGHGTETKWPNLASETLQRVVTHEMELDEQDFHRLRDKWTELEVEELTTKLGRPPTEDEYEEAMIDDWPIGDSGLAACFGLDTWTMSDKVDGVVGVADKLYKGLGRRPTWAEIDKELYEPDDDDDE